MISQRAIAGRNSKKGYMELREILRGEGIMQLTVRVDTIDVRLNGDNAIWRKLNSLNQSVGGRYLRFGKGIFMHEPLEIERGDRYMMFVSASLPPEWVGGL